MWLCIKEDYCGSFYREFHGSDVIYACVTLLMSSSHVTPMLLYLVQNTWNFPQLLALLELLQYTHIQTCDILPLLSLSYPHNIDSLELKYSQVQFMIVFLYYFYYPSSDTWKQIFVVTSKNFFIVYPCYAPLSPSLYTFTNNTVIQGNTLTLQGLMHVHVYRLQQFNATSYSTYLNIIQHINSYTT